MTSLERIPLVDLWAQHLEVSQDVSEGFSRVIEEGKFILGDDVVHFEEEFARFSGTRHCIGVANGTDALELILRAVGVGGDDEVILPANTFVATALAVCRAGAKPVLVDADPAYHLIDVGQVASSIGPRTRAIIVVHLYGQIGPVRELARIASDRGILLIEDAAQAQGARQDGRAAGGFGVAAGTSFYPGKNLGAYGDAGAVLTDTDSLAERVKALRNYGSDRKYHHPEMGFNSRLDTLQAVVLRAKLKKLEEWNTARRAAARRYEELLNGLPGVQLPATAPTNEHVWHLYVVRLPRRDQVMRALNATGIGAAIHYPAPIHLLDAFRTLGYQRGAFPVAEKAAEQILSLPLHPQITPDQQRRVAEELATALGRTHGP